MRIYVASSWRNPRQPEVVKALRAAGHDVYDFRDPESDGADTGFHWSDIDPEWKAWDAATYREKVMDPIATAGFMRDFDAMVRAEVFVLVMPCGRSAHLEMGWATRDPGPFTVVLLDSGEPELMYRLADRLCISIEEVVETIDEAYPSWRLEPKWECRECGCTDLEACVDEKTGTPCHWVEDDLCSACAAKGAS